MTTFLKRTFFLTFGLVLMIMVSACGSTSTTTGSTPSATATTAPASTPTPAASTSAIQTATATVAGKSETILTNAKGMTLYYFLPDAPAKVACTGGCAGAWPPLLSTSDTPTSATTLPGTLSVFKNANGSQVEYSGYLLYTYVKDTAAGQTTGQGVGGKWFVATPDIASFVIRTSSATVAGKSETILTDAKGMTLYYFTPDSPTTVACTSGCQTNWPPLAAASGSSTPLADAPLTGKLTALTASGNQVEYNGHPLYTYISDTAPGDIKGQGVGGKWFVATSDLAAA